MNTFVGLFQNIFNNSISMISTSVFHKTCPILMKQLYNRYPRDTKETQPRRLSPGDTQETPKRHPRDFQSCLGVVSGSSQGRPRVVQGSSKGRPRLIPKLSDQPCIKIIFSKQLKTNQLTLQQTSKRHQEDTKKTPRRHPRDTQGT